MTTPRGLAFDEWKASPDGCRAVDTLWAAFTAGYNAGCAADCIAREKRIAEAKAIIEANT
jgi:hypothetical protein